MTFEFLNLQRALTSVPQLVGRRLAHKVPCLILVRAHAWAVGLVPGWRRMREAAHQRYFSPFLSPSLPLSLKLNK